MLGARSRVRSPQPSDRYRQAGHAHSLARHPGQVPETLEVCATTGHQAFFVEDPVARSRASAGRLIAETQDFRDHARQTGMLSRRISEPSCVSGVCARPSETQEIFTPLGPVHQGPPT